MARITKQLNGLLNLKWVRKHSYGGSTTSPHMEGSSQKCPCQCFGHKVVRSVTCNRSSPGTVDDQTEPETSHEEAYQYRQPSDKIWVNPMPVPKETNEGDKSALSKNQHPAFQFPSKLQLLNPPLPLPQDKPLPEIPTQALRHEIPDRVGRKEQDPRPPGRNSPSTTGEAIANYSPFPKLAVITPPRNSSLQHSSRPYQKAHKPQGLTCANATITTQCPRHIAELYQDPSIEREHCQEAPWYTY